MKKLLFAAFLVLSFATAVSAGGHPIPGPGNPYDGMLTPKQAEYMRYNGASVHIRYVDDRLVSRRARAFYDAALSNPFDLPISCTIQIISSRGINDRYEVIDQKSHINVYAAPQSVTTVSGSIEIKHGRGDDGLQWVASRGHLVAARNCIFLNN